MKKLLLAFTVLFACAATATAQVSADAPANGPVITFKEAMHDFGNIAHNVPATHEFIFTNTGNAPLIINSATAPCGCTKPEYPKEPIMPGKTGVIKVTYNAATLNSFTKTATVNTNGGQVTLTIKGTVIEKNVQPVPPVVNPNK